MTVSCSPGLQKGLSRELSGHYLVSRCGPGLHIGLGGDAVEHRADRHGNRRVEAPLTMPNLIDKVIN